MSSKASHRVNTIINQLSANDVKGKSIPVNIKKNTSINFAPPKSRLDEVGNSAKYFYTVDSDVLTPDQRKFYEDNGYLVFKNVISASDVELYTKRFVDIANGDVPRPSFTTVMRDIALAKKKDVKGEHNITKLQDWCSDDVLFSYCTHPNVLKIVNAIIGPDTRAMHTMLINKPPDLGLGSSRHPPHQDLWYFPFRPAQRIVCAWTALQHIDTENGCLFVKPGSHKDPLRYHEYPNDGVVNKAYHGIQNMTEEDGNKMLQVVMGPGDTVFFHPNLIHGSGRNLSQRFRKAISCHYASSTACEYIELKGTMQEDIMEETMFIAKTLGADVNGVPFHVLWKVKSRPTSGEPGVLDE